jgi:hypothetical protein
MIVFEEEEFKAFLLQATRTVLLTCLPDCLHRYYYYYYYYYYSPG